MLFRGFPHHAGRAGKTILEKRRIFLPAEEVELVYMPGEIQCLLPETRAKTVNERKLFRRHFVPATIFKRTAEERTMRTYEYIARVRYITQVLF